MYPAEVERILTSTDSMETKLEDLYDQLKLAILANDAAKAELLYNVMARVAAGQGDEDPPIEIIVDQDASTVEFRLDGAPVGNGGTACKLTVKPEHKRDLTPAACVCYAGSALTLVAVEAVAR